ncbi:ABC transporter ATP-binding protein [Paenibacillus sinopodophylli]|uniref:ABC transporter ATP-binding protein n=1 Tax=Paenibacillus sinopodophylli TaxID=1837342 RepID=UPI00110D1EF6|nr:ABC transporter ATP-binding protein [Paenibacillus sinopodophylli]
MSEAINSSKTAISLRGIHLAYANRAAVSEVLGEINLSIQEGEFLCILGPSGCGKTSLLKVAAGYEQPTRGEVNIFERTHDKPHHEVGVVFQHSNLFPWLSVQGNVEFGLKMLDRSRLERKETASAIVKQVGLTTYSSLLPFQLSGGMKQRTAIARALATDPRIILMDEPFASLDAITRESLQYLIRKIWVSSGKTIIFITHDVDEALLLGTRIITMQGGPGRIELDIPNPLNKRSEPFTFVRKHPKFGELRDSLVRSLRHREHNLQEAVDL